MNATTTEKKVPLSGEDRRRRMSILQRKKPRDKEFFAKLGKGKGPKLAVVAKI